MLTAHTQTTYHLSSAIGQIKTQEPIAYKHCQIYLRKDAIQILKAPISAGNTNLFTANIQLCQFTSSGFEITLVCNDIQLKAYNDAPLEIGQSCHFTIIADKLVILPSS